VNKFNIRSGSFELSKTINLKEMRPKNFHKNIDKELYKINKIVTTKNGWSIVKKCPVCRKTSFTSWLEKYGNILKFCEKCTHGFSHRYPKKLSDAYENKNQIARTIKTYHKKRKYRIKRFATERIDLIKKFKKRGDLLDFGCGTGWFLEHAKKYYNITGYEPTKSLANMTSKLLKINVESNFLKLQDKKFDIITAFDVIEHVVDP